MKSPALKYRTLSWDQILYGYSVGIFPMGDGQDTIGWYESSPRAIVPMEPNSSLLKRDKGGCFLHIPRSLATVIKRNVFEIRIDTEFENVIRGCANRWDSWINELIINAYVDLFGRGYAHSVEAWKDNQLVGGLYGVAYMGAFFGESMFHEVSNASKAAVVKLYEILRKNGYKLFDIQMMTPLFQTLGAINISKQVYHEMLERAMKVRCKFRY
jgi:leucyl/phenylalanyl-tRNA--protein transferase